jgi:hypothetical protein
MQNEHVSNQAYVKRDKQMTYTVANLTSFKFYGFTFYEDPKHGDEAPLLVKSGKRLFLTDLWDAPQDKDEAKDARAYALEEGRDVYQLV